VGFFMTVDSLFIYTYNGVNGEIRMLPDSELVTWTNKAHMFDPQNVDEWWAAFTQKPCMHRSWGDQHAVSKYYLIHLKPMIYHFAIYKDYECVQWLEQHCDPTEYSLIIQYQTPHGFTRITHRSNLRGFEDDIAGVFFRDATTVALFKLTFPDLIVQKPYT
jgi:hypothetical protein